MKCNKCGSERVIRKGKRNDKIRYKCKECKHWMCSYSSQSTETQSPPNTNIAFSFGFGEERDDDGTFGPKTETVNDNPFVRFDSNKSRTVLVIPDTHLPYEHKDALGFMCRLRDKYKPDSVVHIGDVFDFHSISYHEKETAAPGPSQEIQLCRERVNKWVAEFEDVIVTLGNHDMLVERKAKTHGLPKELFKTFNEVFGLPDTWKFVERYEFDGVGYEHGDGKSGKFAFLQWAVDSMQSTVTGHGHSTAGCIYTASRNKLIFGLGVGCLIDRDAIAMAYGRKLPKKPILGAGVVVDDGHHGIFEPMVL